MSRASHDGNPSTLSTVRSEMLNARVDALIDSLTGLIDDLQRRVEALEKKVAVLDGWIEGFAATIKGASLRGPRGGTG